MAYAKNTPECKTCNHQDRAAVEAVGLLAVNGEISWREAARRVEYSDPPALKRHMENHFLQGEVVDSTQEFKDRCERTARLLEDGLPLLPPEIQALRLVQIHNLRHLHASKPSTQHLIMASKTEQEMTGMKAGQKLLLAFAEGMFGVKAPAEVIQVESTSHTVRELEEVTPHGSDT